MSTTPAPRRTAAPPAGALSLLRDGHLQGYAPLILLSVGAAGAVTAAIAYRFSPPLTGPPSHTRPGPVGATIDFLRARMEVACLQLREIGNTGGSLLRWPETQYHIWSLMGLETNRRKEYYANLRAGVEELEAGVPHVDTGSAGGAAEERTRKLMMEAKEAPALKTLVLIGGGHTHAFVIKMAAMKPIPGVRVVLITRDVMTPYSGMLPGHVAGMYTRDECHIDLVRLAEFAGATMIHAEAIGIDRINKVVHLNKGQPPVPYDVLSIDIGCTPATGGLDAKTKGITKVKPIDGFAARWDALLEKVLLADANRPFHVIVVGGGAGGVELALSMAARIRNELGKIGKPSAHVQFSLVTRGATILSSHNARVQETFKRILGKERGIAIRYNCEVVAAEEQKGEGRKALVCKGGQRVPYDECIWCTSASAAGWLRDTGLDLDPSGFVQVNEFLQSTNDADVFAAGDCANMKAYPRPKAGVFAVRAGPPLNSNLRARLAGEDLSPYEPQSSFLGLIGTGDEAKCVGSKGSLCIEGEYLWKLKDWIDRKWMADYTTALAKKKKAMMDMMAGSRDTPKVAKGAKALAILREAVMRCGGCGSKVGGSILSKVMKRLKAEQKASIAKREEILLGLDSPDDCAMVALPEGPPGKFALVHTVDFFRSFISDPYILGKVAANHALSDCHAMGADTVSALAICVVPYASSEVMEDVLYRMMAGACEVLKESNCTLVGGHTCEGPELALGFSVNGVVEKKKALKKGGMSEGESLILTKPIGTGTLFAANMRCEAHGRDISAALQEMITSNKKAGEILTEHGATSCTDVTGFGVLGHLHEMTQASAMGAEITLESVPVLNGAVECIQRGIYSSLHEDNARLRKVIEIEPQLRQKEKYALLFDPQTAGGLLASVPRSSSGQCIKDLRAAGYHSACTIGVVRKGGIIKII